MFLRTELYINRAFTTRRKILTAGTVPPGLALGAAVKAEVEVHLHAVPVPALDPLLPSHLRREALPTNNLVLQKIFPYFVKYLGSGRQKLLDKKEIYKENHELNSWLFSQEG